MTVHFKRLVVLFCSLVSFSALSAPLVPTANAGQPNAGPANMPGYEWQMQNLQRNWDVASAGGDIVGMQQARDAILATRMNNLRWQIQTLPMTPQGDVQFAQALHLSAPGQTVEYSKPDKATGAFSVRLRSPDGSSVPLGTYMTKWEFRNAMLTYAFDGPAAGAKAVQDAGAAVNAASDANTAMMNAHTAMMNANTAAKEAALAAKRIHSLSHTPAP